MKSVVKKEPHSEDRAEDAAQEAELLTLKTKVPGLPAKLKLFTALPLEDAEKILNGGIDLVPSNVYWCNFIPCQTDPHCAFKAAWDHWERYHEKSWGKCPHLACCQLIDLPVKGFELIEVRQQAHGGYHVCFPSKKKMSTLPAKHLASVNIDGDPQDLEEDY